MIQRSKGFTIIGVVLVLAIAGLIFLMVFVALPALQSSQRDTARKKDVSAVLSAVNSFISNNKGKFPTSTDSDNNGYSDQIESYVKGNLSNNTISVIVNVASGSGQPFTISITDGNYIDGQIVITRSSYCGESTSGGQNIYGDILQKFTVTTRLESGNKTYYCQNN